jgi:ASCH domain
MKIISIRQPWASLIASGAKDVENRTWPTRYRGPILIHASQRPDNISREDIERRFGISPPSRQPLGGVVGIADIVDCMKTHESKWYAQDHYAFVLMNARPLPFVRWRGALSLRAAPLELIELLSIETQR